MAILQELSRDLVDKDGFFLRLQSLQGPLFGDPSEFLVFHRQTIELLADLTDKCRVFWRL